MKRLMVVLICMLFTLTTPLSARQTSQEPPVDPVIMPISSKLAFSTTAGLTVIDTMRGNWDFLPEGIPNWDTTGEYLATISRNMQAIGRINVETLESSEISPSQDMRNSGVVAARAIAGWSSDGQNIMYRVWTFSGQTITPGSFAYRLEIANIATGAVNVVFETVPFTMMNTLFSVPEDSQDVVLDLINDARWNPVYTEWVLIEPIGMGKRASTGEDIGVYEAGLYNYVTGQYISLKPLLPQLIVSFTDWSADGRKIAMNTMTGISVLEFTLQDGQPNLRIIADSINSQDQAVLQWLGAGDVLITGTTIPYRTTFIAQIIENQWYSTEFVALAALQSQYAGGNRDFHLTADTEERNQLSCMFFDQVYASRLQVGQRGRVTFTDGTPSRLRSAPGTAGNVVTQVQEGTSFEIIGGSYCVDEYRWWPLRLDDGTVGWAAEGNPSEYWLEPVE